MYLFDSFAWLEFFEGSKRGEAVKRLLRDKTKIYTTSANYYEVFYRMEQKKGPFARERAMHFIESSSKIVPIDTEIAAHAAELRLSEKLSAIDAFTLVAARQVGARLVTGDEDFRRFEEVLMI
ncbi:PIN domain-containing protein [archaeon]|nr:PIN domain-containing protein [archaeon]